MAGLLLILNHDGLGDAMTVTITRVAGQYSSTGQHKPPGWHNGMKPCRQMRTITRMSTPTIAFIGGGNMAAALAAGLTGKQCPASAIHVVDINPDTLTSWEAQGSTVSTTPDSQLSGRRVWILSVKPQFLQEAISRCRPFLTPDTLIISVAAGISASSLSQWLGTPDQPWTRLVRCMPNTPALVGEGATGMMALDGITKADRTLADNLLTSVGQVVWVDDDAALDAVTALSGSGPAYVFLFLEALIEGAMELGLSAEQSRQLALATVAGATRLAEQAPEGLATLRERVTSRGGTTAAALDSFNEQGFSSVVKNAMRAACQRAGELSKELS